MSSSFGQFLDAQFNAPVPNTELNIIKHLKAEYPLSQHLSLTQTRDNNFPLSAYLLAIGITPTIVEPETHSLIDYDGSSKRAYSRAIAGITEYTYEGVDMRLFKASWSTFHHPVHFYHLVFSAENDGVGRRLIEAVYKWANELKDEIWVFDGGFWAKSKNLYKAVQMASWDDVVLDERFKEGLRRDTKTFFASKEAYISLGITWKRGILLLGPPGNGKTESIKALLKESKDVAPLYVKSFTTRNVSIQSSLAQALTNI